MPLWKRHPCISVVATSKVCRGAHKDAAQNKIAAQAPYRFPKQNSGLSQPGDKPLQKIAALATHEEPSGMRRGEGAGNNKQFTFQKPPVHIPLVGNIPCLGRSGDYGGRDMDKILKVR
jgi:hypothetical protein